MRNKLFKALLTGGMLSAALSANAQIIYIDDSGNSEVRSENFKPSGQPHYELNRVDVRNIRLLNSLFTERYKLNRDYLLKLENKKLLQNFYYEAGLDKRAGGILVGKEEQGFDAFYWGWESPMNQLRGHFLGHYLSACAFMYAETGDMAIKTKADEIVSELSLCQEKNGGEWVGSIPEKYLTLMANGESIWSPQYTLHKTLMGLYDMYKYADNQQALKIADKFADWFLRWTGNLIKDGKQNVILNGETSGMLEAWANMYDATHDKKYLTLMERYGSPYIFQELEAGHDALSLNHANASIPWSQGAARCYEVLGLDYWKNLTLDFWKCAVDDRESFCTGGQGAGEHWIPKGELANFAGQNNQEHCAVYNMIRTADYLIRFTGDIKYADYIEKNLYNGILAQQNPNTGMVAYFLPMGPGYTKGGEKGWGDPTMDFFCCHGSLVQAQVRYLENIYYQTGNTLLIAQYIPSTLNWTVSNTKVKFTQDFTADSWNNDYNAPRWRMKMNVQAEQDVSFDLKLRLPAWLKEKAIVKLNGESVTVSQLNGILTISRKWGKNDELMVEFPTRLYTEELPGTDKVALMEGPIVLAGVTPDEITLKGDKNNPKPMLIPEYNQEYKTVRWTQSHYRTNNLEKNIRFVPLYEIADEQYVIYFPIKK